MLNAPKNKKIVILTSNSDLMFIFDELYPLSANSH